MTGRVFQLIPDLSPGDAIGDHATQIHKILGKRSGGFIVQKAHPSLKDLATIWTEARVDPDDVLVYHTALASQLGDWLRKADAIKVVDHHNFTPAGYFRVYDPGTSAALSNAREELESLMPQTVLALADSDFSRHELEEMGFERTQTIPILIDFSKYEGHGNSKLQERLLEGKQGRGDIIFVGRVAPNKRQEDVIKAFVFYKRLYNPAARLFLVGSSNSTRYSDVLRDFVERLGVEDVHFTGWTSFDDLVAYYRSADLFLSMSEHEGFGVPWLEAMHFGVPVITYGAAAIPETVGNAGLVFQEKNYERVAALIDVVMTDDAVRASLVERGRRRVEDFEPQRHASTVRSLLAEIAAGEAGRG